MRILFLSRATLFSNPGGDTIQLTQTVQHLKKLGIEADVKLTHEKIAYSNYDLLHLFNIIRPADMLFHIKKWDKPYVVSTIFVEYAEFESRNTGGIRKLISQLFSPDAIEYLKVLARFVANGEKIGSGYYLFHGHKKSVQRVLEHATLLLPNSVNEYKRLNEQYRINKPFKVIPNGVDEKLFTRGPEMRNNHLVLCVARIEPLKNQLNLIRAVSGRNFNLMIIGRPSANHLRYYRQCKREAGTNVSFIDYLPQPALVEYYQRAKVHVLPSWFETTGLSSLEAAVCGCNIVITDRGDTREYFGEHGYYCEPDSIPSILSAITEAAEHPVNAALRIKILNNFTWEIAATKTLAAYKEIL